MWHTGAAPASLAENTLRLARRIGQFFGKLFGSERRSTVRRWHGGDGGGPSKQREDLAGAQNDEGKCAARIIEVDVRMYNRSRG